MEGSRPHFEIKTIRRGNIYGPRFGRNKDGSTVEDQLIRKKKKKFDGW